MGCPRLKKEKNHEPTSFWSGLLCTSCVKLFKSLQIVLHGGRLFGKFFMQNVGIKLVRFLTMVIKINVNKMAQLTFLSVNVLL